VLQSIEIISPLNPATAILPLFFVLSLSMAREGYEDYQRYKSDIETNSQKVMVLRKGKEFDAHTSAEVLIGDYIMIMENENFPADVILLSSSAEGGVAFIQTSSLDGEKNLKKRSPPKNYKFHSFKDVHRFLPYGEVTCENPSADLYSYSGKLVDTTEMYSLDEKQLLLKGSILRNTEWIIGFVTYTGNDTKLMQNSQKRTNKLSGVEKKMN
jgi:phospholipid-transporting ATPase